MNLQVIHGEGKGKPNLEDEIRRLKDKLDFERKFLDVMYDVTGRGAVSTDVYQTFVDFKIDFPAADISGQISDHLTPDGRIYKESYQEIKADLAVYLGKIYASVLQELAASATEKNTADLLYFVLADNYENPEDFIFEYNEFKKWKETSEDPMKKRVFDLWIYSLLSYGLVKHRYDCLIRTKGRLESAKNLIEKIEAMKEADEEIRRTVI